MTLTETQPGHWQASGELTFSTCADSWQRMLDSLDSSKVEVLLLDVAGLSRVDSAGLATLVAWLGEAARRKITVQLTGATEQLLQLARVGGVDSVLPLRWSASAAANG